jgi:flagellar biosynthesis/type III secretory pathway protein FliH
MPLAEHLPAYPDLAPGARVIVADDYRRVIELERAQQALAEQLANVQQEFEKALQQSTAQGYAAGLQQGMHDFAARLAEHERAVARFYLDAEDMVASLSFAVAQKLIGALPPAELTRRLIKGALAEHANATPLVICAAPDQERAVATAIKQLSADAPTITLRVDPRLAKGRIMLLTRFASIDIDAPSQIAALSEGFGASRTSGEAIDTDRTGGPS